MRIAIPLTDQRLAMHFGHCETFAMIDAERGSNAEFRREDVPAPAHQPGLLPAWLAEHGVTLVIAGGMGQRAVGLFAARGIQVVTGAPLETPERLVAQYLTGTLRSGENVCDH